MTQAIQTGQVDSVIGNISIISTAVAADDKLVFVEEFDTGEVLGAAVKKGNKPMLDAFENTMRACTRTGPTISRSTSGSAMSPTRPGFRKPTAEPHRADAPTWGPTGDRSPLGPQPCADHQRRPTHPTRLRLEP